MEKISECCENLDKKIENLKLQKSKANDDLNEDRVDIKHILKMRDEILWELNLLWNVFCCAELKQGNSAAYFDLFQMISKDNGGLLKVLFKCLNCDDHFIAFQCHKLLIEVYKCFPNLVLGAQLDQVVDLSYSSRKCGRWLSIYTAEIIKALFLQLDCSNISNFHEKRFKSQRISSDENEKQIGTKDIVDSLRYHWLKMTNHFLVELSALVLKLSTLLPEDAQESRFNTFQQIILTMLSYGKTFIQSCDFCLVNQPIPNMSTFEDGLHEISKNEESAVNYVSMDLLKSNECSKKSKHARICVNENLDVSRVHPSCQICKKAIFKDDDKFKCFNSDMASCTMECKLKLFEKILIQLVEVDHKRCLLHLSRTIFQFLNDAVSSILDQCFNCESKEKSSGDGILMATGVCSILVENVNMMLENIPQVTGKVHFGGPNCSYREEELNICGPLYDDVSLRKVLLLVLKLILVHFHVQNAHFGEIQWQALKGPLDHWLNFVTHTSHSNANLAVAWLVQLFCDQDDELVYLLFCLLQLYQGLFCSKSSQSVPVWANHLCNSLNPHGFFMEFLSCVNYDDSLLLDYLISNETHFLEYFLNYLRYMANNWHGFIETVEQRIRVNKHKNLLQSSGIIQVPRERDVGFLNCSSWKFCRTAFSDSRSSSEDGDNVCGGLDYGNDEGFDEGGNGFGNGDGDCDVSGSSGVDGDQALGFNIGGHGDVDHGNDGSDCDNGDEGSNGGDSNDQDGGSHDEFVGNSDCRDTGNSCHRDSGAACGVKCHNNSGDCNRDLSAKHSSSETDVDNHGENEPRTCYHGTEGTSSLVPFSKLNDLEQVLSCLIRLRFAIERMIAKRLFPYPVTALVRVMKYIETLYEGETLQ